MTSFCREAFWDAMVKNPAFSRNHFFSKFGFPQKLKWLHHPARACENNGAGGDDAHRV
jgi:hypothetical protein